MPKKIRSEDWTKIAHYSLEHVDEMIFWVRDDGTFEYANPKAINSLGYDVEEFYNLKVSDILSDYDEGESRELRNEIDNENSKIIHARLKRKDGSEFSVESFNNTFVLEGRTYNCAFSRDVSDIYHTEKKLIRHNAILANENQKLARSLMARDKQKIIGSSRQFQKALDLCTIAAQSDNHILVTGESGVGKEIIAQYIHDVSERRGNKMISLNCAALTSNDIISRLFGHVKGAYTGADGNREGVFHLAENSTLFLDEIGELSLEIQAMLLRVLNERQFYRMGSNKLEFTTARVVAATNRSLKSMVRNKKFRKDLYFRLATFTIEVPPLRKRKVDVIPLMEGQLAKLNKKYHTSKKLPPANELKDIVNLPFPGNIRELFSIVEQAYHHANNKTIQFPSYLMNISAGLDDDIMEEDTFLTLEQAQANHIKKALSMCNGKISGKGGAAEILDINPNTLISRMKKLNIN